MVDIKVRTEEGVVLPVYSTQGSAGADVRAYLKDGPVILKSLERFAVPTGLFPEIPEGYEIQVRPRSGLAFKNGVTVLNSPGTIDSDYRGEIKVILVNLSNDKFVINDGDRIAQLVVSPVTTAKYVETTELSETERGIGGFGSTGV